MPFSPAKNLVKRIETLLDGRTQKWLSLHSGMNTAKVSRILSGHAPVGLPEIFGIANAFRLTPGELIAGIFDDPNAVSGSTALSDADDVLFVWSRAGSAARAVARYFLTGQASDLRKVHPAIRDEVRVVHEHLSRQVSEFLRKEK